MSAPDAKNLLLRRLSKLLPTGMADQVAEEVVDSLWLAERDERTRDAAARIVEEFVQIPEEARAQLAADIRNENTR